MEKKINKNNKLIGIINIFTGLVILLNIFMLFRIMKNDIKYISQTEFQEILMGINMLLIGCAMFLILIINFVYLFKNRKSILQLLAHIITVISIVVAIICVILTEEGEWLYLVSTMIISGILLIISKEITEKKVSKFLCVILVLISVLIIGAGIINVILKSQFINFSINSKNTLYENIKHTESSKIEDEYISVKKNGKWGYIDTNGKEKIDYIYDEVTDFINIQNRKDNINYYVALARIANKVYVITKENQIIESSQNKGLKDDDEFAINDYDLRSEINKDKSKEFILEYKSYRTDKINNVRYDYIYGEEKDNKIRYIDLNENDVISYDTKANIWTCKTKYEGGKQLAIPGDINYIEPEDEGNPYYNINVYLNGYIPYYNLREDTHGWIDYKGNVSQIAGKIQILDFIDEYILIRNYENENNVTVYFINNKGEIVSEKYKGISILENGYIVKKLNGKNVYLNKELKEKTSEYDMIDVTILKSNNLLIVSNLPEKLEYTGIHQVPKNIKYDIVDLEGNIIAKNCESVEKSVSSQSKYWLGANEEEYKESLTYVNDEFVNDELYQLYYIDHMSDEAINIYYQ